MLHGQSAVITCLHPAKKEHQATWEGRVIGDLCSKFHGIIALHSTDKLATWTLAVEPEDESVGDRAVRCEL